MGRLDGKVTIVTGAGSGIGKATAFRFAAEGARVVVADITGAENQTAADIGEAATPAHVDVSDAGEVRSMIESVRSRFGGLDVLFNNAGIEGEQASTADCTEENFNRVLAVNAGGVFFGMKYAIPVMLERGRGSIINNASVAGLVGFPGVPAYCASKGAVIQLTKTAALEYAAQNIRVNAICPGVIWTAMVERVVGGSADVRSQLLATEPVGRMGTAEEVAAMALYLASDESAFVTGAAIPIDGGFVAR